MREASIKFLEPYGFMSYAVCEQRKGNSHSFGVEAFVPSFSLWLDAH